LLTAVDYLPHSDVVMYSPHLSVWLSVSRTAEKVLTEFHEISAVEEFIDFRTIRCKVESYVRLSLADRQYSS